MTLFCMAPGKTNLRAECPSNRIGKMAFTYTNVIHGKYIRKFYGKKNHLGFNQHKKGPLSFPSTTKVFLPIFSFVWATILPLASHLQLTNDIIACLYFFLFFLFSLLFFHLPIPSLIPLTALNTYIILNPFIQLLQSYFVLHTPSTVILTLHRTHSLLYYIRHIHFMPKQSLVIFHTLILPLNAPIPLNIQLGVVNGLDLIKMGWVVNAYLMVEGQPIIQPFFKLNLTCKTYTQCVSTLLISLNLVECGPNPIYFKH